ncbi:EF-P 5-aminopentanol modification-associated protein YfmF [Weissella cibaria]|uniref:EF-P 5-aminopentanol modification-associated protein YfmF n=1 Tax=Weissella cibaria TaxID=137591 RepID=UPI00223B7990|nr:pitrilysin family protein [Weissella cibaria]MCT0020963.1 insulinase family protein [Weissella cibaria]
MTTVTVQPGVFLHVLPSQQFATTRILVNFTRQHDATSLGGRVLASNMLETASKKYPSQTALARALSELYGASFGTDVLKTGALHTLRLRMTLVHDSFAPDSESLLVDGFAFIREMMCAPLGDAEQGFDPTVFERQREISLDEIAGLQEEKPFYAARQAINAYFDDPVQALPAYGTVDLLKTVTPKEAWDAWFDTMQHDRVDIIVLGDVDVATVTQAVQQLPLTGRAIVGNPYYEQPEKDAVKQVVELDKVNQARLILAYQLHIAQTDRFQGFVFNALFGGLAVSRLFMNVRESAGLAYSVYSDYNPYTGLLMVEAGVDHAKLVEAEQRIDAELTRLQTELVADDELAMIKRLMKADYVTSLDQPGRITERLQNQELIGYHTTAEEWLAAVESVTAQQVQQVANAVKKQLHYELEGGTQND